MFNNAVFFHLNSTWIISKTLFLMINFKKQTNSEVGVYFPPSGGLEGD